MVRPLAFFNGAVRGLRPSHAHMSLPYLKNCRNTLGGVARPSTAAHQPSTARRGSMPATPGFFGNTSERIHGGNWNSSDDSGAVSGDGGSFMARSRPRGGTAGGLRRLPSARDREGTGEEAMHGLPRPAGRGTSPQVAHRLGSRPADDGRSGGAARARRGRSDHRVSGKRARRRRSTSDRCERGERGRSREGDRDDRAARGENR